MPDGQIIRGLSSFYYVESDNKIWECKARGLFKKNKVTPLVGDYVRFEIVDENHGFVTDIKSRANELNRPPISNVDQAILVFSIKEPDFSPLLLDKFLVHVERANIKPIICITKTDLLNKPDSDLDAQLKVYQDVGYALIKTNKLGQGIDELKEILKDKISVFAGQSGVGKSTLLNKFLPGIDLETADISRKLGRGKHTTREVQLIHLPEGGMVADNPGFSQIDYNGIESEDLADYFVEFADYSRECKFRGCLHENEPGCAVKSAVLEQKINSERYAHYLDFLKEIKKKEERKWR